MLPESISLDWKLYFSIINIFIVLFFLFRYNVLPEKVLIIDFFVLIILGILPVKIAFEGFLNEGLLTVAMFYVVVSGVKNTGAIHLITRLIPGKVKTIKTGLLRLMFPVALLSSFMNNTPIVAIFLPAIKEWARKNKFNVSIFLIPLSYATILGGMCTVIGTSTNLIVNGMLMEAGHSPVSLFAISKIGIPAAIVGIIYLYFVAPILLGRKKEIIDFQENPNQYTVEVVVEYSSLIIGKSIEEAGLRHLKGLFLMEIERKGKILPAVNHYEIIEEGDILIFVGVVDSVEELSRFQGLKTTDNGHVRNTSKERLMLEAVIPYSSPLIHSSIRDSKFRTHFNAVVIAVSRSGERIRKKIGDIVLLPGDRLLLEVNSSFMDQQKKYTEFIILNGSFEDQNFDPVKSKIALFILLFILIISGTGILDIFRTVVLASILMIAFKCTNYNLAFQSIEWRLILTIVSAFAIGKSLMVTGATTIMVNLLMGLIGNDVLFSLILLYITTAVLTEFISNSAAAILVFPLAVSISAYTGLNLNALAVTIMFAASASFATPIGYQTNLMVLGPGNYKSSDFIKIGLPMNILIGILNLFLIVKFLV